MDDLRSGSDTGKLSARERRSIIAVDDEADIRVPDKRDFGTANDRLRSVVAAHSIQRNCQNSRHPFDPLSINRYRHAGRPRAPKIQRNGSKQ